MRTAIIVVVTVLVTLAAVAVLVAVTSLTGEIQIVTVTTTERPSGSKGYIIEGVVNGSVLTLENGNTLRLQDVDSPKPGIDCYGNEARRALEQLAHPGATAWVLPNSPVGTASTSVYVVVDGLFLNVELARQGAVAPYFPERPGDFSSAILMAAREALDERRGMWGSCPDARLDPNKPIETGPA